jgi:Stress responsive A/B Barrel Domain
MTRKFQLTALALTAAIIFSTGYVAGQTTPNHFGQPKTILAISLIKFRPGTSDAQQDEIIAGLKKMAAQIPGIKNVWTKPARMEPTNFDTGFVIEFINRDAADAYAESPIHDAWSRRLQQIRETSLSPQITN